jgi:hypothetical protein
MAEVLVLADEARLESASESEVLAMIDKWRRWVNNQRADGRTDSGNLRGSLLSRLLLTKATATAKASTRVRTTPEP